MSLNFTERMLENNTKIPMESPTNISNDKISCSQIPFTYTIDKGIYKHCYFFLTKSQ